MALFALPFVGTASHTGRHVVDDNDDFGSTDRRAICSAADWGTASGNYCGESVGRVERNPSRSVRYAEYKMFGTEGGRGCPLSPNRHPNLEVDQVSCRFSTFNGRGSDPSAREEDSFRSPCRTFSVGPIGSRGLEVKL